MTDTSMLLVDCVFCNISKAISGCYRETAIVGLLYLLLSLWSIEGAGEEIEPDRDRKQ